MICAAGSVVVSSTSWPRAASSVATAAAIVVLPTPPLPMNMSKPLPGFSISSTRVPSAGRSISVIAILCSPSTSSTEPAAKRFNASRPTRLSERSANIVRGRLSTFAEAAARASLSRCNNASAKGSPSVSCGIMPLMASAWFSIPISASSFEVRATSFRADWRGRATRIRRVNAASDKRSTAEA